MNDGGEEVVCHITYPGGGGGARERRTLTDETGVAKTGLTTTTTTSLKSSPTTTTTTTNTKSPTASEEQKRKQREDDAGVAESKTQGAHHRQTNLCGEEFVFVYEEEKRPVVVLLGWAGCQDKYLAKYSAIYEERSYITLRCTAPVDYLFWRRDQLPQVSRRLVQMIAEKCSTEHPVFFHVFSNGGAIFYQQISFAMQQAGTPLKVKGVIFDSSPGERRITSLFRAASAIIGGHPMTNLPISFMLTFLLSFIWLFEIISHSLGKPNAVKTDPIALAEETYTWPQIFLYSNADTLIPASDVEKFASRRAERGVRTQLVLFTDSPHVKHYATYRDVYVSTVCGFIDQCLGERRVSAAAAAAARAAGRIVGDGDNDGASINSTGAPPAIASSIVEEKIADEVGGGAHYLTKRIVLPEEASCK